MFFLCVISFVIMAAGILAVFDLRLSDFLDIFKPRKKSNVYTLADRMNIVQGLEPKGVRKKSRYEIEQILEATGRAGTYDKIEKISFLGAAIGLIVAVFINNWFMAVPFVFAGFLAPRWYVKSTVSAHKRQLNDELETALSIITTSYLRTEDITRSVKENLHYINEPIRSHFAAFLTETQYVNANVTAALNNLKEKIPNDIFTEWCNALIQCQVNRDMKDVLHGIVQKFSAVRVIQAELDTLISEPRFEAICMIFLVIGTIPLLYALNKDWYNVLMFSTPGKITLAVVAGIIVFSLSRIMHLSRPIEYKM